MRAIARRIDANESTKCRSGRALVRTVCGRDRRGGEMPQPFADDERVAAEDDAGVVVPAWKGSSFEVVEPELTLQLLVGALGPPPLLDDADDLLLAHATRQRREVVLGGLGLTIAPFHDEPDVLTTHRWDRTKEPSLRKHFLDLVKNELIQVRRRRNEKRRMKAEEGFQREDLSPYTSSAEAILLEREERQQREDRADRRRDKAKRMVAELHRRVARHPAAAKVLEAWGDGAAKPEELAAKVGMTTGEVYEAKKVIKYHAEAIRDEEGDVDE